MNSSSDVAGASMTSIVLSWLRAPLPRADRRPLSRGTVLTAIDRAADDCVGLRVAVVRNDGIGDLVLTAPLLLALEASPQVQSVTIVAPDIYRGLLNPNRRYGYVAFPTPTIGAPPPPGGIIGKIRAVAWPTGRRAAHAANSWAMSFDLVILPRWDTDLGLNARHWAIGTGAPVVGHDQSFVPGITRRERRESHSLSLAVLSSDPTQHEIEHLRTLMSSLGVSSTVPVNFGREFFQVRRMITESSPIVLHASSLEPKREWPIDRWREVISRLEGTAPIVVIGGPGDAAKISAITEGFSDTVRAAAGTIPLAQLPEFLAGSRLFIGNDSGPAHIAASVGAPVIVISPHPADGDLAHRNSPSRFHPWGSNVDVLQPARALPPCRGSCSAHSPHCIRSVSVDEVVAAAESVQAEGSDDCSGNPGFTE